MRSYTVVPSAVILIAFACGTPPTPGTPDDGADGPTTGGRAASGGRGGSSTVGGSSSDHGSGGKVTLGGAGPDGSGGGPVVIGPKGCGLDNAAFCEDFEAVAPGGRAGEADENHVAFARWGHYERFFDRPGATSSRPAPFDVQRNIPTLCGAEFTNVLVGEDARVCPGKGVHGETSNQFNEVFDDGGDFGLNSLMVRQPFNFANGGVLVFDVDGKRNHYYEGHGWWFEVWITEDPSPIPYHSAPTVSSFPRNGLGLQFTPIGYCLPKWESDCNELANIFVTRDHEIVHEFTGAGTFPTTGFVGRDREMNHFEFRLSKDRIEVWATDAGSTDLHLVDAVDGLDLSFDVGFVHLQHSHYNAFKDYRPDQNDGVWASPSQVYRWDNIGFDGPVLPALRAYDVADNQKKTRVTEHYEDTDLLQYGYELTSGPVSLSVDDVDTTGATAAMINLNVNLNAGRKLYYRVNEGEEQTYVLPSFGSPSLDAYEILRALTIEIPVENLVDGTNTLQFRLSDANDFEMLGNVDLSLVVP